MRRFEIKSFLLTLFLSAFTLFLDPFSLSTALRNIGQSTYYNTIAGTFERKDSDPKIIVVLATDGELRRMNEKWPLSHGIHAELIYEIASMKPRAIFIDFVFADEQREGDTEYLIETVKEVSENIPIFMIAPEAVGLPPRSEVLKDFYNSPEIQQNIRFVDPTILDFQGNVTVMPLQRQDNGKVWDAPAFSIAKILCDPTRCQTVNNLDSTSPTEIVWFVPPAQCSLKDIEIETLCENLVTDKWVRLSHQIISNIAPSLSKKFNTQIESVFPYKTLGVSDILYAPENSKSILSNNIVMIGGSYTGIRDKVESPIYGSIPGVFAHAALLDNIFVLNGHTYSANLPLSLPPILFELLLLIFLVVLLYQVRFILMFMIPGGTIWAPGTIADVVLVLSASMLYSSFESAILRTTPEHWLLAPGLVTFALTVQRIWRLEI